jgi:DNA-binding response OmpR family regulator
VKCKILVVEDNADIRKMLRISLADCGEILEAENGASALTIIQNMRPGIVLLDVKIQGLMNGFEVLEVIKSTHAMRNVVVIMITACGQEVDREKGMDLGADAYLIKPFSPRRLIDTVREFVN